MKHALVIGGTGMLAKVSVWLSENGYHVSVIGRNPEKMQRVTIQNPAQLTSVLVGYTNSHELVDQIRHIQQKNGPIQLLVVWVHSTGPNVIPDLLQMLPENQPVDFYHVNGSSANLQAIKTKTPVPAHIRYHQIQLGFQIEDGISRWLTTDEIVGGTIKAIQDKEPEWLIGMIEPWEKRP